MNSKERHEARYLRRKAKRDLAKQKRNEGHTFDVVTSPESLRKAFYSARKGVNWKASVQRYGVNVLRNCIDTSEKIRQGENISKGFIEFDISERGKKRHITSVHISERVVQKSVCDNGIVPVMEKSLIYDNGASQKGKGTDFARERLKKHLRQFYRKYGTEGYILLGDCHDFFGSIDHSIVKRNMEKMITDQRLIDLAMQFVDPFPRGLGLGSQVCQILAVTYQNEIDHCIKEVWRKKWYARYMDDFYVICRTKDEAKELLAYFTEKYREYGIELNLSKTQIVKLTHGFVWLQDRIYLLPTGRIVDKPGRSSLVRNRRKLKKIAKRVDRGEIPFNNALTFYNSHIGYLSHKDAYHAIKNVDKLFNDLFIRRFMYEQVRYA